VHLVVILNQRRQQPLGGQHGIKGVDVFFWIVRDIAVVANTKAMTNHRAPVTAGEVLCWLTVFVCNFVMIIIRWFIKNVPKFAMTLFC